MSGTGPLHAAACWQIRLIEDSATRSDPAFCAWLRLPVNADAFGRVSEAWALAGESLLQSRRTLDEAGRGVERAIPRFSFRRIMALVACGLLAIGLGITVQQNVRSEARRVGTVCVRTCQSRCAPATYKKNKTV